MTERPLDYDAVEWDKDGRTLGDDPRALLALPEGLLALEGLPVMFHGAAGYPVMQDKVLDAARCILENRTPEQAEKVFHNQAQVMAFASQEFGWLTGKDLGLVSVANYMQLPKQTDAQKAARAEQLDGVIDIMKSGMLTTREGAKKLFPDMDVDDVFDRHEQRIEDAKASQNAQMESIRKKHGSSQGESSPNAPATSEKSEKSGKWADKVSEQRRQRPNPCLGF